MLLFTIGDIAKLSGITTKTIRHYHQVGLLAEPQRDTNNYRMYSLPQLEQVQQIVHLKKLGLSLQQIKTILDSDDPDAIIRLVLKQHQRRIQSEISKLEEQQADIEAYLSSDKSPLDDWRDDKPSYSAMTVVTETVRPQASGLADILFEVESHILSEIDRYDWEANYEIFWHIAGQTWLATLMQHESQLIFWLERYVALGDMDAGDLQGKAWLEELKHSPARRLLARSLQLPSAPLFPEKEQDHIRKLLPALLFQSGSTLQRQFFQLVVQQPNS